MTLRARLLAITLAGCALMPGRTLHAQTAVPGDLGRRITVHFDRIDLATALSRLRTVFRIPLAFSSEAVPSGHPVSIDCDEEPVADVLSKMLTGTGLRVIPLAGGAIVIAPAPAAPSAARSPEPLLASGIRELDQIVVMGTPAAGGPERDQPTAVSVARTADFKDAHFTRTADLFRAALPGVVLWDQGPGGPPAEIAAVRGASSFTARGIKTYVDGIEVASPTLITLIDPRSIERIEVIRGPQGAALYGSDAINGVIQVVTRKGSLGESPRMQGSAALAAGPFNRQSLSTMLRQDYAGGLAWGGSRASFAATGAWGRVGSPTSIPRTQNWSAHAGGQIALGSLLVSGVAQGGQFDYTEDKLGLVQLSETPMVSSAAQVDVATIGATAVHQTRQWWIQTMVAGYDRSSGALGSRRDYLAGIRHPLGATDETASRASLRYSSAFTTDLGRQGSLVTTVGVEHALLERSRGAWDSGGAASYVSLYDDEMRNTGSFIQAKLRTGAFVLNAGTRAEWSSAFGANYGAAWAPSAGMSWSQAVGNLAVRLRGGWGRGIRPPEPGMSRGMESSIIRQQANAELAPEVQAGYELGADLYAGTSGYLRATYFDQRATDLIQAVFLGGGRGSLQNFQFQNVGAIKNRGVELEAGFRRGRFGADAQYYLTNSTVQSVSPSYSGSLRIGDQLPEIPRSSGSLRFTLATRRAQFAVGASLLGRWTGYDWSELAQVAAGQAEPRPSYRDYLIRYPGVVKPYLSASFDLTRQFSTYLNIDNLTNQERYERHNGNPPAGRSVMFGIEVKP